MKTQFCQVTISAEDKKNATEIATSLLKKKLIVGCLIVNAPAKFWWKGKIIDMKYFNVEAISTLKNKQKIIYEAERISDEEVPIIRFNKIEVNQKTAKWIMEYL